MTPETRISAVHSRLYSLGILHGDLDLPTRCTLGPYVVNVWREHGQSHNKIIYSVTLDGLCVIAHYTNVVSQRALPLLYEPLVAEVDYLLQQRDAPRYIWGRRR